MSGKGSLSKQNSAAKKAVNQRKGCTMRTCNFISPVRYLKQVGGKFVAVVVRITTRAPPPQRERARTSVAPIDSQRAEAIHDCIDFINSSSTLPRSNSVAS
ncbi:uncharacterized protein LOC125194991 [Salvia hispanica]|uniref:uncharacterized protein LOC125194991 n=1 Tax=Salvia hispanica TaxID=49212 RepID=UPI0020091472|nr:uncharacterized protein LOC125194991 [Salvia hispanica]